MLPAGHPQGYADCFDAFVAEVYDAVATGDAGRRDCRVFADGLRAARLTDAVLTLGARGALGRRVDRSRGGRGMSESAPLLEVRGITKQYPGVRALKGVDFDVRAGEVHCLLGPNGAGKSTLIKCVSGVVAPTEGEIRVEGELLPVGEPSESMARGVGTIYQELDLVEDLRVAESVFLGHEPRRLGLLDRARDARRDDGAARAPRSRRHQAGHVRAHAAPGRAAGRLDRPRALAQREAADHGRAVLDPRRRRGRDRCSASSAGSRPTAWA